MQKKKLETGEKSRNRHLVNYLFANGYNKNRAIMKKKKKKSKQRTAEISSSLGISRKQSRFVHFLVVQNAEQESSFGFYNTKCRA